MILWPAFIVTRSMPRFEVLRFSVLSNPPRSSTSFNQETSPNKFQRVRCPAGEMPRTRLGEADLLTNLLVTKLRVEI